MPTRTSSVRQSDQVRAWVAIASIPVVFVAAMAVGYVLYEVLGYAAEDASAPLWADLLVAAVVLVMALVPCVAAVVYGRRSHHAGERRGLVPLAVGAVVGLALIVLTVATTVADAAP